MWYWCDGFHAEIADGPSGMKESSSKLIKAVLFEILVTVCKHSSIHDLSQLILYKVTVGWTLSQLSFGYRHPWQAITAIYVICTISQVFLCILSQPHTTQEISPVRHKMNNTDHLIIVQYSAGNPWTSHSSGCQLMKTIFLNTLVVWAQPPMIP